MVQSPRFSIWRLLQRPAAAPEAIHQAAGYLLRQQHRMMQQLWEQRQQLWEFRRVELRQTTLQSPSQVQRLRLPQLPHH